MNNVALLFFTHTEYNDIWIPCLDRLLKYGPKITKYCLVNDKKMFEDKINEKFGKIFKEIIEYYGADLSYSRRLLTAINKITEDYILLWHDNNMFYKEIDHTLFEKICQFLPSIKPNGCDQLRMSTAGSDYLNPERSVMDSWVQNCKESGNYDNLIIKVYNDFKYSVMPTIWRKVFWKGILEECINTNYRNIEGDACNVIMRLESDNNYLLASQQHYPHLFPYYHFIQYGKWFMDNESYLHELTKFLKEYDLDIDKRGLYYYNIDNLYRFVNILKNYPIKKKKVALLISGRANRYKECLLPLLEKCGEEYEIDIFCSLNDQMNEENDKYYEKMNIVLEKWLKKIEINKYVISDNEKIMDMIKYTTNAFNMVGMGDKVANYIYSVLSMYYNDGVAFEMATKWCDEHYFEYDIYLRFRSDLIGVEEFPKMLLDYKLHCVVPKANFKLRVTDRKEEGELKNGEYHCYGPMILDGLNVTSDIAYGPREFMKIYCNTYNYITGREKEKGLYLGSEFCLISNIMHNLEKKDWKFFAYSYDHHPQRHVK